jgi:hypothetical protein
VPLPPPPPPFLFPISCTSPECSDQEGMMTVQQGYTML